MKILMVTCVFPNEKNPDLGTFSMERLRCLMKLGEVQVVAPVPWFPHWFFLKGFKRWYDFSSVKQREVVEGVVVHHPRRLVIPKIGGITSGFFYERALDRALRKIRRTFPFDVIDAHFLWPDGYAAAKVGDRLHVPVCITAHGSDVHLMPTFKTIRSFIEKTVCRAARVVAVSKALSEIIIDLGAPPERIKVIHNGVDISRFRRMDPVKARDELGLEKEKTILISVGALLPVKGHGCLLDAMNVLVNEEGKRDLKLIIVGEGPERSTLEKQVRDHGLERHVDLIGTVPHSELYRWLSAADLFCLTSSREGWPTVFFEAWACGIPVVATAVLGVPEAICSDRYGILIEKQDPKAVAAALQEALARKWNPAAIMAYAADNTWEKMVKEMYTELEDVVREHRERHGPGEGEGP